MIGQKELLSRIDHQLDNEKFPHFSIIVGEKGSGKRMIANYVASRLQAVVCEVPAKVDDVRKVIDNAYNVGTLKILYLIPDVDNMSSAAANALLKVTEEPPNNAYFILTCENVDNMLPTIKSRGVTYMIEPYSYEDKCDYLDAQFSRLTVSEKEFILNVASTIGDVEKMLQLNLSEYRQYVNLVVDNIAEVSGSNAFKIGDKIALKGETDKYDLRLFFKSFNSICVDKMLDGGDDSLHYGRVVAITGDYLQQTFIRGINLQMLFDNWILDVREEWL